MTMSAKNYWFEFEASFDPQPHFQWFRQNWTLSLWVSALYVMLVFGAKRYMRDRKKFDLRKPLVVWSSILAVFSILGTLGTAPDLLYQLQHRSIQSSVCDESFTRQGRNAVWAYMFTVAKTIELGDTLFIVLRKQPLVFLHWYHHITVMIYCFYTYGQTSGPGRYFTIINYTVHSVMYSYYALRALRVRVPRWVNMVITSLQLLQMVSGILINSLVLLYQHQGFQCRMGALHIFFTFVMYGSYLVLFANFFYQSYMKPKPQHREAAMGNDKEKGS